MSHNVIAVRKLTIFALCGSLAAGIAWADGAVYAKTNAIHNNQVLVYHRDSKGNLSSAPIQTISTGGGGSGLQLDNGDSLASAGSMRLDYGHHLLFVVNPNSANENTGAPPFNQDCNEGSITSFRVGWDGRLTFADQIPSGGLYPNSLTVKTLHMGNGFGPQEDQEVLYVLNAGGPGSCQTGPNVTGFKVRSDGNMQPLGSSQPINPGPPNTPGISENCSSVAAEVFVELTGAPVTDFECGLNPPSFAFSPAQVRFTPDGNQLIVTVKGTSTIYVFPVDNNGHVDKPAIQQSSLPAVPFYFGFTFDKHEHMLVTELFGSASEPSLGTGAVSSFTVRNDGGLDSISPHVNDGQTAACWIALEPKDGNYAYVANNLSGGISTYQVGPTGTLTLVNTAAATVNFPNDVATAEEDHSSFLYVVEAGAGMVGAFQINLTNGSLTPLTAGGGLSPRSPEGLAAF